MPRLTQSQLLQKYKGNDKSVNLNRALRRAAALGPNENVLKLIEFGALISSKGSDGKTILHWAVIKSKIDNFYSLRA